MTFDEQVAAAVNALAPMLGNDRLPGVSAVALTEALAHMLASSAIDAGVSFEQFVSTVSVAYCKMLVMVAMGKPR
jgi:hypothetical protein